MIIIIVAPLHTIPVLRGLSSSLAHSVSLRLTSGPGPGEVPLVLHEQRRVVTSLVTSAGPVIASVPDPIVPVSLRFHKWEGGGHRAQGEGVRCLLGGL